MRSPSRSSRPNIRSRFWTACDAAPFHRLSIEEKTKMRPVRVAVDGEAAEVRLAHVEHAGRPEPQLDPRLARVGVVDRGRQLVLVVSRAGVT